MYMAENTPLTESSECRVKSALIVLSCLLGSQSTARLPYCDSPLTGLLDCHVDLLGLLVGLPDSCSVCGPLLLYILCKDSQQPDVHKMRHVLSLVKGIKSK